MVQRAYRPANHEIHIIFPCKIFAHAPGAFFQFVVRAVAFKVKLFHILNCLQENYQCMSQIRLISVSGLRFQNNNKLLKFL